MTCTPNTNEQQFEIQSESTLGRPTVTLNPRARVGHIPGTPKLKGYSKEFLQDGPFCPWLFPTPYVFTCGVTASVLPNRGGCVPVSCVAGLVGLYRGNQHMPRIRLSAAYGGGILISTRSSTNIILNRGAGVSGSGVELYRGISTCP